MTLLVHFLQYWLHLSEITDTDYRSNYWCVTESNMQLNANLLSHMIKI